MNVKSFKLEGVLKAFGLNKEFIKVENIDTGLINHTWKVSLPGNEYILQRVNNDVFEEPCNIAHNIKLIADYLKAHHPSYPFVAPIPAEDGSEMIHLKGEGYFRLFPFVKNSHTVNVVETPRQAFEAASQFGRFTKVLDGINVRDLKITIPSFHNLSLRYQQFLTALTEGNEERISECKELISQILKHQEIVAEYDRIKLNPEFKLRVTHHDTKISNVLFDDENNGLCVIDLDTIMPGDFISDVGDMMRTYLCPVSEEEQDFSKLEIRDEFYKAIVQGYCNEMKHELTDTEMGYFFYAAKFMIYMQAIRFLTDYLNNDIYYGAKYDRHNYVRAKNQIVLLQRLLEKEGVLSEFQPNYSSYLIL